MCVLIVLVALLIGFEMAAAAPAAPTPGDRDPIAYVGHGAAFDGDGKQINVTPQFIREAQQYYRRVLLEEASSESRTDFEALEKRLPSSENLQGQAELVATSELLDALLKNATSARASEIATKTNLLKWLLRAKLSLINQPVEPIDLERFQPPDGLRPFLETARRARAAPSLSLRAGSEGLEYIKECEAAGVPIPPDWGRSSWVSKGTLANEFISEPLEAEVFVYDSASPEGLCVALPRAAGSTIKLLGIICLGKASSQACFWDNQKDQVQFDVEKGVEKPLAEFAGGAALNGGSGGECTLCHLGENPFIIHPKTALGRPNLNGLDLRSDAWYRPRVHADWAQNDGPTSILDSVASPGECTECHTQAGSGGRFPSISRQSIGYCGTVLPMALARTMPPGRPGDPDYEPHVRVLLAECEK